jgi:hypothetical protein
MVTYYHLPIIAYSITCKALNIHASLSLVTSNCIAITEALIDWLQSESESELLCNWQSVSQYVLVSSPILRSITLAYITPGLNYPCLHNSGADAVENTVTHTGKITVDACFRYQESVLLGTQKRGFLATTSPTRSLITAFSRPITI